MVVEVGIVLAEMEEPYLLYDKVTVVNIFRELNVTLDVNGILINLEGMVVISNVDVVAQRVKIYEEANSNMDNVYDIDNVVNQENVDSVNYEPVNGIVLNCNHAFYLSVQNPEIGN